MGKCWGAQHAPGTSVPADASDPWADSALGWGGCKVPTCLMVMHSTVGGGGFSIGSSARCARPSLAVTRAPTSAGHPTAGGICSDAIYPTTPHSKAPGLLAAPGLFTALLQVPGAVPSCPGHLWGHQRGACHSPLGTSGQMVKQGSRERNGEPFRKTLPALLLPKDFLQGFASINFSLSCKVTLFQPCLCPV